jgi:uncharacterized protein YjbI with pentapeptide repeats
MMKFDIKNRFSGTVQFTADIIEEDENTPLAVKIGLAVKWAIKFSADLREADLRWADLREANLREADLRWADLREANLRGADLREANLCGANLREADLREANLREANLREADLRWADLCGADLREANLREADLDFSSGITFRCSSFNFKADMRLAAQLAYHFCRIDFGDCGDAETAKTALKGLANKFHRADECWRIE